MIDSLYGRFRQNKFSDIYKSADEFIYDYEHIGIPAIISMDNAGTLYYLLYSRYANSVISSSDTNRFKLAIFSTIWQYGPTWEKKLEVQAKLRGLSDSQLAEGTKQIINSASNPGTEPEGGDEFELQYINAQNVSKTNRGILERYSILLQLLENDVTEAFLSRFKVLFLQIVEPEAPLIYESEDY